MVRLKKIHFLVLRIYTVRCILYPMNLRTYLSQMSVPERVAFAERCNTSAAHLRNISYGAKTCGEALAMDIERESGGVVRCEDLRPDLLRQWAYMRNSGNVLRVRRIGRPVVAEAARAIERKPE